MITKHTFRPIWRRFRNVLVIVDILPRDTGSPSSQPVEVMIGSRPRQLPQFHNGTSGMIPDSATASSMAMFELPTDIHNYLKGDLHIIAFRRTL